MLNIALKSRVAAKRLIQKYGREIVIIKPSEAPIDPTKPYGPSRDTSTRKSQFAVFDNYVNSNIDSDKTKMWGKAFITYYDENNGDIEDFSFVDDNGKRWKIKEIDKIQPGVDVVAYIIKVEI